MQHISAFQRSLKTSAWAYTFTQEWPVVVQDHQLSFTLPVQRTGSGSAATTGIGDVALNYRYQLLDVDGAVAAAPRLSLLVPTGSEARDLGSGGLGVQVNLPVSVILGRRFVTHWNAGVSVTPAAKNAVGAEAATAAYGLGVSAIWLVRPSFNVLVELAWTRADVVTGPDRTAAEEALIVNPGLRWAHNFASGLQIVPGIAFLIGLGPAAGEQGVFLYLSFEHPFRRQAR